MNHPKIEQMTSPQRFIHQSNKPRSAKRARIQQSSKHFIAYFTFPIM